MAVNIKFNEVGIFGIVVGVVGAAYGIWQEKKRSDISKKLDVSLEELEKKTPVDIREDIVNKATMNAVDRVVSAAVQQAVEKVSDQIRSDADSMIRKDVDRVYADLKDGMQERVNEEIDAIDYDEMRSSVRRKAEQKVFDEFCGVVNLGKMFGSGQVRSGGSYSLNEVSGILDQFWSDSDKQKALNTIFGNR